MSLQPAPTPAVVLLHVWTVPTSGVLPAMTRLATDRLALRGYPGLTFAKLLGTGSGQTFAPQDADPHHWALLTCWDAPHAAATVERSRVVRRWDAAATDRLRIAMTPLASTGLWSRRQPFGAPVPPKQHSGPVAALTRARIEWRQLRAFWRSVPPVADTLTRQPGLLWSTGIGEAPVGLQGTFSLWRDADAMRDFAYGSQAHRDAIRQTRQTGWFAEELFARFAVEAVEGTVDGRQIGAGAWPT